MFNVAENSAASFVSLLAASPVIFKPSSTSNDSFNYVTYLSLNVIKNYSSFSIMIDWLNGILCSISPSIHIVSRFSISSIVLFLERQIVVAVLDVVAVADENVVSLYLRIVLIVEDTKFNAAPK